MMFRLLWSIVLLVLSVPVFAQAPDIAYKLPKGWKESNRSGAKLLTPESLKEGEAFLVLLFGAEDATKATPEKQLSEVVAKLNKGATVISTGDIDKVSSSGGVFVVQAFVVEDEDLGKHARLVGCLVVGARRLPIMIIMEPVELTEKFDADVMALIGSVKFKAGPSSPVNLNAGGATGKAPTGDTPSLFPGMPGWLPSGRGMTVPKTGVVNGRPQGVWYLQSTGDVYTYVFFPDGTYLTGPRWAGRNIVDIEAQRIITPSSVGTFKVENGNYSTQKPGFKSRADAFSHGKDQYGLFFKSGKSTYRELRSPSTKTLEGTWQYAATRYVFHADGTMKYGQVYLDGRWMDETVRTGKYFIDGHMVVTDYPNSGIATTILALGICTPDLISIGIRNFIRVK